MRIATVLVACVAALLQQKAFTFAEAGGLRHRAAISSAAQFEAEQQQQSTRLKELRDAALQRNSVLAHATTALPKSLETCAEDLKSIIQPLSSYSAHCLDVTKVNAKQGIVSARWSANELSEVSPTSVALGFLGQGSYASAYLVPAEATRDGKERVVRKAELDNENETPQKFQAEACLTHYAGLHNHGPKVEAFWRCDLQEALAGGYGKRTTRMFGMMVLERLGITFVKKYRNAFGTWYAPSMSDQQALVKELEALIDLGIVHNDNHGGNIGYRKADDSLVVFDFGLAQEYDADTPAYQYVKPYLLSYSLRLLLHSLVSSGDLNALNRCINNVPVSYEYIESVLYYIAQGRYADAYWGIDDITGSPKLIPTEELRCAAADRDPVWLDRTQEQNSVMKKVNELVFKYRHIPGPLFTSQFSLDREPSINRDEPGVAIPIPADVNVPPVLMQYIVGDALYRLQETFMPTDGFNCLAPKTKANNNQWCHMGMSIRVQDFFFHANIKLGQSLQLPILPDPRTLVPVLEQRRTVKHRADEAEEDEDDVGGDTGELMSKRIKLQPRRTTKLVTRTRPLPVSRPAFKDNGAVPMETRSDADETEQEGFLSRWGAKLAQWAPGWVPMFGGGYDYESDSDASF